MPHQILFGWENETLEAKTRAFLRLTPEERVLQMIDLWEFTRQLAPKLVTLDAPDPSRRIQILKQRPS